MGPNPPINVPRKRPLTAVDSVPIPNFGVPISHKVSVIQETRSAQISSAAAGGPSQAAAGEIQSSVPVAGTFGQEVPQVNGAHSAAMQNDTLNVISQPDPEETPVEPPPIQSLDLGLKPAIMERTNSYASISIS